MAQKYDDGYYRKCITIEERHEEYIQETGMNFSGFIKEKLDEEIEEN